MRMIRNYGIRKLAPCAATSCCNWHTQDKLEPKREQVLLLLSHVEEILFSRIYSQEKSMNFMEKKSFFLSASGGGSELLFHKKV
jgi:hypothetical protein